MDLRNPIIGQATFISSLFQPQDNLYTGCCVTLVRPMPNTPLEPNLPTVRLVRSQSPLFRPAIGVVYRMVSDTTCIVVTSGVVDRYVGLTPGADYFVGPNGFPTLVEGVAPPGVACNFQHIGLALTDKRLLVRLEPAFSRPSVPT